MIARLQGVARRGLSSRWLVSPTLTVYGVGVRLGVNHVDSAMSSLRPLLLQERRKSGRAGKSEKANIGHQPTYSITSSARAIRIVGTSKFKARAVARLSTNSYFEACSTGRSAGFAPLNILSM